MYTPNETAQPILPELLIECLERSKPELFPCGQTVCTHSALSWAEDNLPEILTQDHLWQRILLRAHVTGCWEEMDAEDRNLNLSALKQGREGRILSVYTMLDQKIYVITEWDRSTTTILLPEDY